MILSIAYQQQWMPGVFRSTPAHTKGLRDWLLDGGWSLDERLKAKRARLFLHDMNEIVDACVNDSIDLANAAFESATAVDVGAEERSCAWQVISCYYAAYFASNALMRLGGFACTNLDVEICTAVNECASLYGQGGVDDKEKLKPGVYYLTLIPGSTPMLDIQSLEGVKGGVHIQFWAGFLRFLEAINKEISIAPLTAEDKKQAKKQLAELRDVLTRASKQNGSWLSEVRNAVNYRFEKGVWFPYVNSEVTGDELRAMLRDGLSGARWLHEPNENVSDCHRLVLASSILLRWVRESLSTLEGKARYSKRSRIRDGALAFAAAI